MGCASSKSIGAAQTKGYRLRFAEEEFARKAALGNPNMSCQNVVLIPREVFLSWGAFQVYEECIRVHRRASDLLNIALDVVIMFVSHRWQNAAENRADSEEHVQYSVVKNFMLNTSEGRQVTHLWLDLACINQDRGSSENPNPDGMKQFLVKLDNIGTAICCSHIVLVVPRLQSTDDENDANYFSDLAEYLGRGWCLFELLTALMTGANIFLGLVCGHLELSAQFPAISGGMALSSDVTLTGLQECALMEDTETSQQWALEALAELVPSDTLPNAQKSIEKWVQSLSNKVCDNNDGGASKDVDLAGCLRRNLMVLSQDAKWKLLAALLLLGRLEKGFPPEDLKTQLAAPDAANNLLFEARSSPDKILAGLRVVQSQDLHPMLKAVVGADDSKLLDAMTGRFDEPAPSSSRSNTIETHKKRSFTSAVNNTLRILEGKLEPTISKKKKLVPITTHSAIDGARENWSRGVSKEPVDLLIAVHRELAKGYVALEASSVARDGDRLQIQAATLTIDTNPNSWDPQSGKLVAQMLPNFTCEADREVVTRLLYNVGTFVRTGFGGICPRTAAELQQLALCHLDLGHELGPTLDLSRKNLLPCEVVHLLVPLREHKDLANRPLRLILNENTIGAHGVKAIREAGLLLNTLRLAECGLGLGGTLEVIDLLRAPLARGLRQLWLDGNGLGPAGARALAAALAEGEGHCCGPALENLDMECNGLDAGAKDALRAAWAAAPAVPAGGGGGEGAATRDMKQLRLGDLGTNGVV